MSMGGAAATAPPIFYAGGIFPNFPGDERAKTVIYLE
jgi:hypothetical protein